MRIRWENVIEHGNEKEQGLREAIALGDGGQVRSVLTEAEGARVLEEGMVLLAVQAIVQWIMLEQRIRDADWSAAISSGSKVDARERPASERASSMSSASHWTGIQPSGGVLGAVDADFNAAV